MNIDHLRLFVRVAAIKNISSAGQELGLSAALASAHLNKLESDLAVRLLHRTTRKVSLTEEGSAFLPHAEDVLATVEGARAAIGIGAATLQGTLRVALPASFGRMHIVPLLPDFLVQHPGLRLDLRMSDTIVDMVEGGFDIAIRNSALKDSSLIARKLVDDQRILCASPAYLERWGEPKTPEDLSRHQCLVLGSMNEWSFTVGGKTMAIKVHGPLKVDNGEALRDACALGAGVAVSSRWSVYQDLAEGRLQEVLSPFPLQSNTAIWAVYPSSRLLAPKVRAFIDFLVEALSYPVWMESDLS